jgi:1,4-dihydroxy-2-naphthoate octaprenyltransferase
MQIYIKKLLPLHYLTYNNIMIKCWIEAMRLRTLPVSISGVIAASALASLSGRFMLTPALLCLVFAVLAQIASNFANEYFDYRAGADKPGRVGPRRGVTEGDISPRAMLIAAIATMAVACAIGLTLISYGGWQMIIVGVIIALGAFAYSAGPYPLSRHALGEAAVIVFFGIVPVATTYYLMAGELPTSVILFGFSIGLMAANILVVNNYRDYADDYAAGKETLVTKFGRATGTSLYLLNGFMAMAIMSPLYLVLPLWAALAPLIYLVLHTMLWIQMQRRDGSALNPLLGLTAMNMLLFTVLFAMTASLIQPL